MKVSTPFLVTDTRSPEENIMRALYAFFLNSGCMDELLLAQDGKLKFGSNSTADVGAGVWAATKKVIRVKFLEWMESDALAMFICESSVGEAIHSRFTADFANPEPFTTMTGQRFKDLTGYDRKRMPKDIKKSWETKARNAVPKFLNEWEHKTAFGHKPPHGPALDEWLDRILDPKDNSYLPFETMRPIHNLLQKCVKFGEDMTDSIQKVRDEVAVARVMLS